MKNFSFLRVSGWLLAILSFPVAGLLWIFSTFCGLAGDDVSGCSQRAIYSFLIPIVMFLVGICLLIIKKIKK